MATAKEGWILVRLKRLGLQHTSAELGEHWLNMLWEQIMAVVPISIQLVLVLAIFFKGRTVDNPGELSMGLICAVVGLTMFVDALRVSVMPLGEMLGERMPAKLPMPVVLLVAGLLGILCTYAEPAIASLRPLARLVSRTRTPYLHLMLNELQEPLVFSVGLGVGLAAVLGTLRFVNNWGMKPLIALTLTPTLICTCWMQWGNPDLAPLIGLAWDLGGVTTGPVTVPILLAVGIGVMKTSRQREAAKKALKEGLNTQQPSGLDGFGIVTLASILPILCVCLMSIVTSFIYSKDWIINTNSQSELDAAIDRSPLREVVFAFRAILPLNAFLILLVLLLLREPVPAMHLSVNPPPADPVKAAEEEQERESAKAMGVAEVAHAGDPEKGGSSSSSGSSSSRRAGCCGGRKGGPGPFDSKRSHVIVLVAGVIMAQVGQILFNIGLTYGFTSLGDQVGTALPASFLRTVDEPGSPLYEYGGGVALTLITVFLLGILATRAEPALNVLGMTVQKLSKGKFTRAALVYAVCLGVGSGMAIGATKILFGVPVILIILIKYGIAVVLTYFSDEDFTAIAWDSAGVTTGPVTVPFVLSLGIGFNKASGSPEGFGILTAASVAPIITVLLANFIRAALVKAKDKLAISRRASLAGGAIFAITSDQSKVLTGTSATNLTEGSTAAETPTAGGTHGGPSSGAGASARVAPLPLVNTLPSGIPVTPREEEKAL